MGFERFAGIAEACTAVSAVGPSSSPIDQQPGTIVRTDHRGCRATGAGGARCREFTPVRVGETRTGHARRALRRASSGAVRPATAKDTSPTPPAALSAYRPRHWVVSPGQSACALTRGADALEFAGPAGAPVDHGTEDVEHRTASAAAPIRRSCSMVTGLRAVVPLPHRAGIRRPGWDSRQSEHGRGICCVRARFLPGVSLAGWRRRCSARGGTRSRCRPVRRRPAYRRPGRGNRGG